MRTRQILLDAAFDLFMEQGYRNTTTKQIANKASINESSIFRLFKNKKNIFKECLLERSKQAIQTDFNVLSYHDSLHKNIKKIVTSLYESGLTTIPMYRLLIKVNLIEQNILNIFKRDISQITDQLRIFIEGLKIRYNLKEFESDDLINIITINCFQNAFSLLIVTQGNPNKDQIQTAINDLTSHYESLVLETTND